VDDGLNRVIKISWGMSRGFHAKEMFFVGWGANPNVAMSLE